MTDGVALNPPHPCWWVSAGRWFAQGCLLVLLVVLPWSFGGVDPFSQVAVFPLLLLAVLGAGLSEILAERTGASFPWCALPAGLLVVLGGMQTWDLGREPLAILSPTTVAVRAELLAGVADPSAASLAPSDSHASSLSATVSVDPPATRREVALLLAGLTTYVLAMRCFISQPARQLLAGVVAVNGVAIAYFGIVQMLSWNGQLYWSIPIEGTTPYGPFVNRNSGGGYQVMTLAACGYLVCGFLSDSERDRWNVSKRPSDLWSAWLPPRSVCLWTLLAALVVIVAGITVSLSRGAWLGAVVGVITVLAFVRPQRLRAQSIAVIVGLFITAATFLAWLSLTDEIRNRIPGSDESVRLGGRADLWWDVLRMIPDYWQTGTGLGTFGLVQPMYQQRPMTIWFDQAENLFLQALVEGGIIALLCLLAMVIWAAGILRRAARISTAARITTPEERAIVGLGLFVIGSQVVCASFDFGLRYPANQLMLAILVGAAIGAVASRKADETTATSRSRRRVYQSLTYATLAILLVFGWREMAWSGGIELALNRGEPVATLNEISDTELDDLDAALTVLLTARPDSAEGHLRRADLAVQRYRRAALRELQAELGATTDLSEEALWSFTSLATLRRQALEAARAGDTALLTELREHPLIESHLGEAARQANMARTVGPFHFRIHQLLAELAFLRGDPRETAADVAHAIRLVPQQPDVRFWAGELELQAGRLDTGCQNWQRCLELTPNYDRDICAAAESLIPIETFIDQVLPSDSKVLARLLDAGVLPQISEESATQLSEKFLTAATTSPDRNAEQLYVQSHGLELGGQQADSLETLRQAVASAPERTLWRLRLADHLQQQGMQVEAVREVEVALRLNPASSEARRKLEEYLQAAKP